jgi:4a-hydroxytetrahydrobiopterin dehydratase
MNRLSDGAVTEGLAGLRWSRDGDTLVTTRTFAGFAAALAWVVEVGDLAEARNHHPDIAIAYDRVSLVLTTHSAGGLTDLDLELAAAIDALGV